MRRALWFGAGALVGGIASGMYMSYSLLTMTESEQRAFNDTIEEFRSELGGATGGLQEDTPVEP